MKSFPLLFLILLSGCVATPKTVHVYDPECDIHVRKATLEANQSTLIKNCTNETCVGELVGASVIGTGSVIISGSIVVVSNVVYWIEREQNCRAVD
ncbi:hypothetical protein [Gilvimarinus xylanilyticus]|uniref:Uncharacterized protein n=1 Tax=Gilvimarinus xylanilyticus TaxID=2944139 RepID=A0A9X2KUP8_9GAMM|nr:hypothetical protein [Gilvimarinus xylanilyticus]MCP8900569.1 hypothetical protein [Gilvimarinus xylanilyticus]